MVYAVYTIYVLLFLAALYFITKFLFDLLLRGFHPFLPSRPWVVEEIMAELEMEKDDPKILALSTGRSGFVHALEKAYPKSSILAVEPALFPFLVSYAQYLVRDTRIRIRREKIRWLNVRDVDLIYNHLYPDAMQGLGKKLKFECRPDTIIISTGFIIPDLEPYKTVELPDRKGKFDWLSKNQKLFQSRKKKYKKQPKAYFYRI